MNNSQEDKIFELTQNDEFVKWVKSDFAFKNEYWSDYKNQLADEEVLEDAIDLIKALDFEVDQNTNISTEKIWNRIDKSTLEENVVQIDKNKSRSRRLWPLMAAASFLLLAFLFWPQSDNIGFNTTFAENKTIDLPDNSQVVLNAKSSLSFDKKFNDKRLINMSGEAFFEVEKGEKFTVITELGKVEVLGTSFNVYSRDNVFNVICKTGKVKVSNESSSVVLIPGEKSQLRDNTIVKTNIERKGNEWVKGVFHFEDMTLANVTKEMERQFAVKFEYPSEIGAQSYTGFFDARDLDQALQSVFWPLNYSYKKESNKILISSK